MGPVDVVIGLPLSIKIAWGVWMVWAIANTVWYWRSKSAAPKLPAPSATTRTRSGSRPVARKPSSPAVVRVPAPYGSPDFITVLDAEEHGVPVHSQ